MRPHFSLADLHIVEMNLVRVFVVRFQISDRDPVTLLRGDFPAIDFYYSFAVGDGISSDRIAVAFRRSPRKDYRISADIADIGVKALSWYYSDTKQEYCK